MRGASKQRIARAVAALHAYCENPEHAMATELEYIRLLDELYLAIDDDRRWLTADMENQTKLH